MTAMLVQWAHSLTAWAISILLMLVYTPLGVAGLPLVRDVPGYTHRWIRLYFRNVLALCRLSPRVHGVEALRAQLARGPVVFAANHASLLDILVLTVALPADLSFVAKAVLFRIPVLGFVMRLARMVPLEVRSGEGADRALDPAAQALAEGRSVMWFPEGTRTTDGQLGPFRRGAAVLARMSHVPLVPVALAGLFAILPRGRVTGRPGPIDVFICEPVDAGALPDSASAMDSCRERIQRALG